MIQISWYDEEQLIILWQIKGRWTLSDYQQAAEQTSSLMARVTHRVDVISDFSEAQFAPPNIVNTVVTHHREIAKRDSNYGICVLVGADLVMRVLAHLISRIPDARNRIHIAESFEEAETIIQDSRRIL